jgi:hypothetical protein
VLKAMAEEAIAIFDKLFLPPHDNQSVLLIP